MCKDVLFFNYYLFAGTSKWKKSYTDDDLKVVCSKLKGKGKILRGKLELLGVDKEE